MANNKRLTKSTDSVVAGVCGGIAEFIGWPKRTVRLLCLAITIFTAIVGGIIAYLIVEMVMPEPDISNHSENNPGDFNIDDYRTN